MTPALRAIAEAVLQEADLLGLRRPDRVDGPPRSGVARALRRDGDRVTLLLRHEGRDPADIALDIIEAVERLSDPTFDLGPAIEALTDAVDRRLETLM